MFIGYVYLLPSFSSATEMLNELVEDLHQT